MSKQSKRLLEIIRAMKEDSRDEMTDEELQSLADEKETPKEDEPKEEEPTEEPKEEPKEEEPKEEPKDDVEESERELTDEEPKDEPSKEEPKEDEDGETEEETKENKNSNIRKMKKDFSLLKTIRSMVENKPFDAATQAVIDEGRAEMRKAGISSNGQIVLPTEKRAVVTVTAEGEDVVETEIQDLLMPLRAKNILSQLGAKYYGNLVGDVQIPIMGKNTVGFAGEIEAAADGAGTFNHVTLQPRRITSYIDISRQLLAQDSVDVENAIITDLGNAISNKIEEQFFSDATGDTKAFAGIFSTVAPTAVASFKELVDKEADIEDANVIGECKYALSNKAKAALRNMAKSAKSTELVYEKGEVDGTPALNSSHVSGKNYVYGDFSNVAVGQWSSVDITVDTVSQAINGCVRIVVNAYVDVAVLRPEAFTAGTLA